MAQPARIVVVDALQHRAARQDLEQLVDLLLVLGERERDLRVLDREHHFVGDRVLVERHRHAPRHWIAHIAA
jgi:methylase of polypeptide subunit release factors